MKGNSVNRELKHHFANFALAKPFQDVEKHLPMKYHCIHRTHNHINNTNGEKQE